MIAIPLPDPAPGSTRPVTVGWAYDYDTAAVSKTTGRDLPGWWFTCHVPARGRRVCVLFRSAH